VPVRPRAKLMVAPYGAAAIASRSEQSLLHLPTVESSNLVTVNTCVDDVGVTDGVSVADGVKVTVGVISAATVSVSAILVNMAVLLACACATRVGMEGVSDVACESVEVIEGKVGVAPTCTAPELAKANADRFVRIVVQSNSRIQTNDKIRSRGRFMDLSTKLLLE